MVLRTEDLFLGALGICRGGELRDVEIRAVSGRRMAIFLIEGAGMEAVHREFHSGPSVVDLRLLKSEVARLKNLAFDALRREGAGHTVRHEGIRAHQGDQRALDRRWLNVGRSSGRRQG
jgi:hypothetical protein